MDYYLHWLPLISAREHYSTAMMHAGFLNKFGGKGDPNNTDSEPMPIERMFTPEELLPYFAQMNDQPSNQLTPAAAVDILKNASRIPAWALELIPFEAAKRIAG